MSLKDFQFLTRIGTQQSTQAQSIKRRQWGIFTGVSSASANRQRDLRSEESSIAEPNLILKRAGFKLNSVLPLLYRFLSSVNHPNIISYRQSFIEANVLYIVMEYAEGGDLHSLLKKGPLSQPYIWNILIQVPLEIQQVARGLSALHDLRILHRDIKAANILLKDDTIKLGDLNVAYCMGGKNASKGANNRLNTTPMYAAPQIWREEEYDKKSDIWSLGCVAYECAAGHPPFKGRDMESLMRKILRGFLTRIPDTFSQELYIVIRMLLQVVPHLRPSCDKLLEMPLVSKHLICLPDSAKPWERVRHKLNKEIKLSVDAKERYVVEMPRPRYQSSHRLDSPKRNNMSNVNNINNLSHQNNINHVSNLRGKRMDEDIDVSRVLPLLKESLPLIKGQRSISYGQPQPPSQTPNTINTDILKLMQGTIQTLEPPPLLPRLHSIRMHSHGSDIVVRITNPNESNKASRKILYEGRMRAISPHNAKKIIAREKQKYKLHSILDSHN